MSLPNIVRILGCDIIHHGCSKRILPVNIKMLNNTRQQQIRSCSAESTAGLALSQLEPEEEENILRCLNTFNQHKILKIAGVNLATITEILKHRQENGPLISMEEIRQLPTVDESSLDEICEKLKAISIQAFYKEPVQQILKYFSPSLSQDCLETVKDVTAMEVCINSVCFTTMTRDLKVTAWEHVDLLGSMHHKQTPAEIIEQAVHVVEQLPKSSIFLVENRVSRKITSSSFPLHMFIGRLQTAIQMLLNADFPNSQTHKVFHVKDTFLTKAYDLRVGGERVSGQTVVQHIENGTFVDDVQIAPGLFHRFHTLESGVYRERYTNCLLMVLAFCQHISTKR